MFSIINSGLTAAQKKVATSANNMANASTVGFKKSTAAFSDVFANDPSANPKTSVGTGAMVSGINRIFTQGGMTTTTSVTDLAIAGKGFFVLGNTGNFPVPTPATQTQTNFSHLKTVFSGSGLPEATWPALQVPVTYPTISPVSGVGLQEFSQYAGPTTPQVQLRLKNIDDSYAVYIDGNLVKSFTNRIGGPSQNADLDITQIYVPGQSEIKMEFSNVDGPWAWDYEILVDGKIVKSGSNSLYTWDPKETGLVETVVFQAPAIEEPSPSSQKNIEYTWTEGGNSGAALNTFFASSTGSGKNSNDGFDGKNSYIVFGTSGTEGARSLTINNLDMTHNASINFEVRRGNDSNGGEQPDAPLENFNLLFSIDGGITFNLLKSFNASDPLLTNWTAQSLSLPVGAKTSGVILKFEQSASSGPQYDHWAISQISFTNDDPPPVTEPISSWNVSGTSNNWQFEDLSGTARNVFLNTGGPGTGNNSGFASKTNYISFGGDGAAGSRELLFDALDLRGKGALSFNLIGGDGSNGGEQSDTNEPLRVEYSNDGGVTFKTLVSFINDGVKYSRWSTQTVRLPEVAQTDSTIIRFNQPASSGPQYDHWGVNRITFVDKQAPAVLPVAEPQYQEPDTRAFTRAGNFQLDKDGYLVTATGLKLLGTDLKTGVELAAVKIPFTSDSGSPLSGIDITPKGILSASYGGNAQALFEIPVAVFKNDSALRPLGSTNFGESGESGSPTYAKAAIEAGSILAGTLEQSNVDITTEIMNTLQAQQVYNGNARMLQAYVETASKLTDKI